MEKEISNGTMLGIVLIALAVIIALGFGIFAIAKGTANEGVTKVQTNLANVQASEFTDYDQTVVTGTQAKSSISNFEGKPVAILIATSAWLNSDCGTGGVEYSGASVVTDLPQVQIGSKIIQETKEKDGKKVTEDKEVDIVKAINYNALLKGAKGATDEAEITLANGKYIAANGFEVANGAVQFHNNIGDMNKSGMTEYVNPGSKFSANLIQDNSGTTMGIVFVQISGK
mgnify:CR=1 FL=1